MNLSISHYHFIAISGSLHVGLFALTILLGRSPVIQSSQPMQIEIFETSQPVSTVLQKKIKARELSPPSEIKVATTPEPNTISSSSSDSAPSELSQSGVKDTYAKDLLVLIHQRKVYPRLAQKMGHRGRLLAKLRIAQDGRILDSQIVEPSPHVTLNEAAEKLMKSLPRLKPFPDHVKDQEWVFHIPIDYKIE
jgi:TonB family protein